MWNAQLLILVMKMIYIILHKYIMIHSNIECVTINFSRENVLCN
jgi:hypothetical protein